MYVFPYSNLMKFRLLTILSFLLFSSNCFSQKGKQFTKKASEFNIKKDYENAILYSTKAINKNPNYIKAYIQRSYAYHSINNLVKAESDAESILKIDSTNGYAYFTLGLIYLDKKKYNSGINYFKKCINLNHKKTWSYHNIGHGYNMMKDYENAVINFSKGIELNTTYHDTYKIRAYIYLYRLKKYQLAVKDYDYYLELYPNDANTYLQRAWAKQWIGDIKGAFDDITKSMENN